MPGTLQFGLGDNLATYLGWLIPWGTPLTLLGATADDVAAAQRHLVRIGIERVEAAATGTPEAWAGGQVLARYPVTDFAGLAQARGAQDFLLLDVRRQSEWDAARIEGAVHIPLHELPGRIGEIGPGQVWVHCQSGYRASVAAALLDAAGRDVVLVDDDFDAAQKMALATAGPVPAY